ncbi:MAG: PAC2 family protein [Phycisphaerae bacterium]|nr:PAC2 family protein [Phycisphaerae bacterium]
MPKDNLTIHTLPRLADGRMVLAFSGWMDGGDVSTATVDWLARELQARRVAEIDPEGFFIYNFPGSMEVSALFRPHTEIVEGIIEAYHTPKNDFYCDEGNRLILFSGKEPNLHWADFGECIFSVAEQAGVSTIYFVGSFAGMTPHTREPRFSSSLSEEGLKPTLEQFGVRLATYEGPASFATHLITEARSRGIKMATVVAEIPTYIEGPNPRCIEAMVRKLASILNLQIDIDPLRGAAGVWEQKVSEAIEDKDELTDLVRKLEAAYDSEIFDTELGDLKQWLQQKGIRVD